MFVTRLAPGFAKGGPLHTASMIPSDFYNDRKFCEHCQTYVSYLQSTEHSYCVQCGHPVRLFSETDWNAFNEALKERRPKGGRPPKDRNRESA